jgi:type IV secretory pathway TraG/TraD family ATPase VirD4
MEQALASLNLSHLMPWFYAVQIWLLWAHAHRWLLLIGTGALIAAAFAMALLRRPPAMKDSHGSARLATTFELLASSAFHGRGMPVGQLWGGCLSLNPEEDVLVIGPKGSGKSRRIIMHAIDRCDHSIICLDQSGELLAETARVRMHKGPVYVLDFGNPRGHHYNFLDGVRWNAWDQISDLQRVAEHLTYLPPKITPSQAGTFYVAQTKKLYVGCLLYGHYDRPEIQSIGGLRRFIGQLLSEVRQKSRQTFEQMSQPQYAPDFVRETAQTFLKMPESLLGGVLAGADQWLMAWADPKLDAVTADTTILMEAFQQSAVPATLYLRVNIEDIQGRLRPAARLFCDQFCFRLCDRAPDAYQQEVTWVLDDMKGLGHLPMISDVPEHRRKWGHRFVGACQDLGQLKDTFGEHYGGLLSNCTSKVFFRPSNHEDAGWIVRELDKRTLIVQQDDREHRYSQSVMTIDQVKRMRHDQVLVFTPEERPALLRQLPYYRGIS